MAKASKRAVDRLRETGSGQSPALRELEESGAFFQQRLKKVLSNLPPGELIDVPADQLKVVMSPGAAGTVPLFPEDRDAEAESPGDLAAQEQTHPQ